MTDDRSSPLHRIHVDAGAGFTDFAGWQMPVRYSSDLAEHHAVRSAAGLFDLSHMAEILVSGPGCAEFLDFALAGRLSAVKVGKAKYSLLLTEQGGIVDDLIVYRLESERFLVVANAGNRVEAFEALQQRTAGFDVEVLDLSDEYALIAVQGPVSRAILEQTAGITSLSLDDLGYYASLTAYFEAAPMLVARTGYTGEDGFELYVPVESAEALWRALMVAGTPLGLVPAGLASRDTLRLEAGMPLYGHELSRDIRPAQAGLGRVVAFAKPGDFVGRAALEAPQDADAAVLVGLVADGRRAGRAGYAVLAEPGGEPIGEITSGALSPTLGHPVAMAFVQPAFAASGTPLFLDVRGTAVPATVVSLPFYTREV